MTVQLPPERHTKVLNELRSARKKIYKKKATSVRTLVKLIGMLSATRIKSPKHLFISNIYPMFFIPESTRQDGIHGPMASSNIGRTLMVEPNNTTL
jgi:hypothetical protein